MVISVLGYLIESLLGKNVSPQARGIVGFITAAVVIYLAQFIVPALKVTVLGALIASLVIGIIDLCAHRIALRDQSKLVRTDLIIEAHESLLVTNQPASGN